MTLLPQVLPDNETTNLELLGLRDADGTFQESATVTGEVREMDGATPVAKGSLSAWPVTLISVGGSVTVVGQIFAGGNYRAQLPFDIGVTKGRSYKVFVRAEVAGVRYERLTIVPCEALTG